MPSITFKNKASTRYSNTRTITFVKKKKEKEKASLAGTVFPIKGLVVKLSCWVGSAGGIF